ncbi:MAG: ABC transporter permease [Bryobacteraceae bacterium]
MSLYRRVANLFCRAKLEQEIDAEIRSHIQLRIDDNIAAGMTPEEARRDALLRFGNRSALKGDATAADTAVVLDGVARDIRYAVRQLRKSPGFAITAVVTLALAIAANVAVFSVLNALVLRPLNVAASDRLVQVVNKPHGSISQSYPDYIDYRSQNTTFSDMAIYRIGLAGLSTGAAAYKCWFYEVSGSYFGMLGVKPELGRLFDSRDEHGPNSVPYIVLSDAFWHLHFGGDPGIVGKTIDLNKQPFTIIGIVPKEFHGTEQIFWPDVFAPIVNEQQIERYDFLHQRFSHGSFVIGMLKPGVTAPQATDNLNAIARTLAKRYREDDGLNARLVTPGLNGDQMGDPARGFLSATMVMAFLVLVAACMNLAGIFAARASDRGRELAIRLAIGSSRWHILRQLLAEALLVSLIGGVAGTFLAAILLRALTYWQPFGEFPVRVTVIPDASVYIVAVLLSLVSGILPGLFPARQIWRMDATHVMKGGASATAFRRLTLRDLLLGAQIALCALLLTASLVALRGMERSLNAPLGFQPQGAMLAYTDLHMAGYSGDSQLTFYKRLLDAAARLPGVLSAGIIDETPLSAGGNSGPVYREGTTDFRASNSVTEARIFSISPGYLHAAKTHLLAGRDFTWHDDTKAPKVVIVNETFAHKIFASSAAIGRRFAQGDGSRWQVVGIVEDGKYNFLTEEPQAAMFFPSAQYPVSDVTLVVRSHLPEAEMASTLNRMLAKIDPNLPFTIQSWPDSLALMLFPARAATVTLGVMGLFAAVLAITGVFGMAAYSVSKRRKEFGIRIALGAQSMQLMRTALGRPFALLLCGSAAGLTVGVFASRLLAQIVYEATPRDPIVMTGVIIAMSLVGIAATWIPAKRALAINPAALLREET